jgi:hypothetical protein
MSYVGQLPIWLLVNILPYNALKTGQPYNRLTSRHKVFKISELYKQLASYKETNDR